MYTYIFPIPLVYPLGKTRGPLIDITIYIAIGSGEEYAYVKSLRTDRRTTGDQKYLLFLLAQMSWNMLWKIVFETK